MVSVVILMSQVYSDEVMYGKMRIDAVLLNAIMFPDHLQDFKTVVINSQILIYLH